MTITDQEIKSIVSRYGTASYLFDVDAFKERMIQVKEVLGDRFKICYAMKANPFLTQAAAASADSLEVCSPGEYRICQRAGICPDQIVLSGVYKEAEEIEAVLRIQGAGVYTAESLSQLELLESCARNTGCDHVPVLLRVTSGNQFGMEEAEIIKILSNRDDYPRLVFKGLQFYSGTQKKKLDQIHKELISLDQLCTRLNKEFRFEVQELEYGPGFYIPYFQGEQETDELALLGDFRKLIEALHYKGRICLEMGRFLAAGCGSYITKIVDTKYNGGQNYGIIDGGINHINYYGQAMAMKIPFYRYLEGAEVPEVWELTEKPENLPLTELLNRSEPKGLTGIEIKSGSAKAQAQWTICGALCTAGDVLVKNLPLGNVKPGDILVFERIGAYSVTEGIYLFLSRKLPKILLYSRKEGIQMVRDALPTDGFNSYTGNTHLPNY